MSWETVIGLEVHVQLATKAKIFSGAATTFGALPNSQACAIDLAMPGTLPVLNGEALAMAVRFGLAINAKIAKISIFERKNYFYPDLPKGYQISQMAQPIVGTGQLEIILADYQKMIRIHHAHLEEDAGKSLHDAIAGQTGIDLNRAGTPLLEIVSEPDLRSAAEAVAYLRSLHSLVTYLGISDGNMAEGSLRCDVNVSMRQHGDSHLGTRTEIKNVNSFRFVERAILFESARQIELLEAGGQVIQQTRLYDAERDETRAMRSKEEANDYRYFPCPDLLPVQIDEHYIATQQQLLPELPTAKRQRFIDQLGLTAYDAQLLTASRAQADYFEQVQQLCQNARLAAHWINGELASYLNRHQLTIEQSPLTAQQLAQLLTRLHEQVISGSAAKQIFALLWQGQYADADSAIAATGARQISDNQALLALIDQVIAAHPTQVAQYIAANEEKRAKMLGFFVGQVMKLSKGSANPAQVNQLLAKRLLTV